MVNYLTTTKERTYIGRHRDLREKLRKEQSCTLKRMNHLILYSIGSGSMMRLRKCIDSNWVQKQVSVVTDVDGYGRTLR